MERLEERATCAFPFIHDISFMSADERNQIIASREGYIKGAVEQRLIDIDRACEWLEKNRIISETALGVNTMYTMAFVNSFRRFMMSNEKEAVQG